MRERYNSVIKAGLFLSCFLIFAFLFYFNSKGKAAPNSMYINMNGNLHMV